MESISFAQNACKTGHNLGPPWAWWWPRRHTRGTPLNHESWNPRNPCSPRIKEFFKELAVRTVNVHSCFSWLVAVSTVIILMLSWVANYVHWLFHTAVVKSPVILPVQQCFGICGNHQPDCSVSVCPDVRRSGYVLRLGPAQIQHLFLEHAAICFLQVFFRFFCPKCRTLVGLI